MKTKLFFAAALSLTVSQTVLSQTDEFDYTSVDLSMGASYGNRVFFDLSANNIVSQPATTWDIAFFRNSAFSFGERVNDAKAIKVYQASADPAAFETVSIADKANWGEPLYNPDITEALEDGVFANSTLLPANGLNFGWGSYSPGGIISGKVVFVLEYENGDHYKFFIEKYQAGYTFKYAKWNGTSWEATQTRTIANGTDDAFFNYFSFDSGAKVENLEPSKSAWDLMFTRYYTFFNGQMMYRMAGVLQSPNVSVAYVRPETQGTSTFSAPAAANYSKTISTIGHSWKPTIGAPHADAVYYIKEGSTYYRLYFTTNGGTANGNMFFKYKNITSELSVADFGKKGNFGIYPNPTKEDKKINILLDVKKSASTNGTVQIFDFAGKKVHESAIANQSGFSAQQVDLSKLTSGVYIVKMTYGGQTETKKLIVK